MAGTNAERDVRRCLGRSPTMRWPWRPTGVRAQDPSAGPSSSLAAALAVCLTMGLAMGLAALIGLAAAQPAAAQSTPQRQHVGDGWQTIVTAAREDASAPIPTDDTIRSGVRANDGWPDADRTRFIAGAPRVVRAPVTPNRAHAKADVLSTPADMALIGFAGLLMVSFLSALRFAVAAPIAGMRVLTDRSNGRGRGRPSRTSTGQDDVRAACDDLLERASSLWTFAEAAVLRLDTSTPLRSLLMKELQEVTQRLSKVAETSPGRGHVINANLPDEYWKLLRQRLRRTISDLERIWRTAEAAQETIGDRTNEPRIPSNRDEALLVLGASSDIDTATLQRLVRALRQCWHPDLAQSDSDRTFRGARIAQINVAYDILSGRRAEA